MANVVGRQQYSPLSVWGGTVAAVGTGVFGVHKGYDKSTPHVQIVTHNKPSPTSDQAYCAGEIEEVQSENSSCYPGPRAGEAKSDGHSEEAERPSLDLACQSVVQISADNAKISVTTTRAPLAARIQLEAQRAGLLRVTNSPAGTGTSQICCGPRRDQSS